MPRISEDAFADIDGNRIVVYDTFRGGSPRHPLVLGIRAIDNREMWFTQNEVERLIEHLQRALLGPLGYLALRAKKERGDGSS